MCKTDFISITLLYESKKMSFKYKNCSEAAKAGDLEELKRMKEASENVLQCILPMDIIKYCIQPFF